MTDPFADGTPVGDHHHWERPQGEPCPNCDCCSARLCQLAIDRTTSGEWDGACHFLGTSADFDLAECPCWRNLPGGTPTTYTRGKVLR